MKKTGDRINVGVIGVGGWGKNLARNYSQIPEARLRYICDLDDVKLGAIQAQVQAEKVTNNFDELLADDELHGVIVATTAPSHYRLCKEALLAGKDVFVEKPFVLTVNEARELVQLSEERGRVLMIGHLLEYHPVVNRLKELVDSGELGEIRYIYSQRLNLGTVRMDENALWNFAPHDISVILYLLGELPKDIAARGQSYLQEGIEDVVFLSLNFSESVMAHVHVSWLDPHKVRRLTIVGSKRMAVFDDLQPTEKLRIYDKGAEVNTDYDTFAEYIGLRFGDICIPHIRVGEPLRHECEHFLDCVRTRQTPLSDGRDGLRVIQVLEAAGQSLGSNGKPIVLGPQEN
jgi:predicted dehydrogenase